MLLTTEEQPAQIGMVHAAYTNGTEILGEDLSQRAHSSTAPWFYAHTDTTMGKTWCVLHTPMEAKS